MENILDNLKNLLQKDERLISKGELLKNKVIELAIKLDECLKEVVLSWPYKDCVLEGRMTKEDQGLIKTANNHSSWLTFMKNRLDAAKLLLYDILPAQKIRRINR